MRLKVFHYFQPNQDVLDAIQNLRREIMDEMQALKNAIADLSARLDEFLAGQNADIQARIDAAIAADDAGEAVELRQMKDDVVSIMNRVPPKFDPSANGG